MDIVEGCCQCGCGKKTTISDKTDRRAGWMKNKPRRFISGHNRRGFSGVKSPSWKGGRFKDIRNHIRILMPNHPRADCKGYIKEHIFLAEKALGKVMPPKVVVYHHSTSQLVICQNQAYHLFLHKRMREAINANNLISQ